MIGEETQNDERQKGRVLQSVRGYRETRSGLLQDDDGVARERLQTDLASLVGLHRRIFFTQSVVQARLHA